jgi:Flp pilus assembly pilin Flp
MAEYGVVLSVVSALALGALMLLSGNIITALNSLGAIINP